MAIAFVNSADLGNNGGTTNSLSVAYTAASGSSLLIVCIEGDGGTIVGLSGFDDITGVSYASQTMSLAIKLIDNSSTVSSRYVYLYYLYSPPSGSHNVIVNTTNSHYIGALVGEYSGTQTSGSPDNTASNTSLGAGTSPITSSITTIANNCWAIALLNPSGGASAPTAGTGDTLRTYGAANNQPGLFDSNAAITPAGSYSMTFNQSGANGLSTIIASFAPFVAGTTTITRDFRVAVEPDRVQREPISRVQKWSREAIDLWNRRSSGLFVPRGFYVQSV